MADDATPGGGLGPTPAAQRVATLDVLRGAAILGILLVNIELFRGSSVYLALAGEPVARSPAGDWVAFAVGWLISGKFLSSFALLFGVGTAMIAARTRARGLAVRPLLARRYAWLAVFGLAHMVLLFSGDILFVYGLAGMLLLAFVRLPTRPMLWWAGGILAVYGGLGATYTALQAVTPARGPTSEPMAAFVLERGEAARAAFTEGGLGDQLLARSGEAALVQLNQLAGVPWILALFLLGVAIGRSGVIEALGRHRRLLGRVAGVAVPAGLVMNLPQGVAGPLGMAATPESAVEAAAVPAMLLGAPLLAVGYLAALAWLCQRPAWLRRLRPLQQTGRMALTAYLLQSVLCTGFFVGLGFYDRLSLAAAMGVVGAVWVVVLAVCSVWLRWRPMGPVEALWRRLTYGAVARARR